MKRFFINSFILAPVLIFAVLVGRNVFGDEYVYDSTGKRDPFIPPIISQARMMSLGLQTVETIDDIKFEGVIFDPFGKSMVVLNGEVVKEGDIIFNVEVVTIYHDAVTVKIYNKTYTIELVKEGGRGL